ncbi:MAF protein [Sphaerochaeta pleomorpha str. Grapes]|uniref:Nucleoside triphosphate pyrophosphatase n=1 Tax=Sphaerochaeta pleomorpha (strain ATCC BAA-1885 / DSM 22778 / Grapes) TaxID=158190 RepID=G8QXX9_SPHPG|nr:Maf family protein [Sphaerochaeta pleomorpha]AEV28484.1 MAF protein [Sphaerochaeta pleomorpha str. Grapes]
MPELTKLLPKIILASQSPARKRLLEDLGIAVTVIPTDCDESYEENSPDKVVAMLALRKLETFRKRHPRYTDPVLCCDTMVFCGGKLIGKAENREEAFAQLASFSGKTQSVHSGWALWYNDQVLSASDTAYVTFKELTSETIESYLSCREWVGAAGSYRIQEQGSSLVRKVEGDFATVIGLPLSQISEILLLTVPVSDGAEFPPPRG